MYATNLREVRLLLGKFFLDTSAVIRETEKINLRHYEKATKFEKNLPLVLTKQLFLLSSVKTGGRFFRYLVAFSEKLDFTIY